MCVEACAKICSNNHSTRPYLLHYTTQNIHRIDMGLRCMKDYSYLYLRKQNIQYNMTCQ